MKVPSGLAEQAARANELRRRVLGITPGQGAAAASTFYAGLQSQLPAVRPDLNVAVLAGAESDDLGPVLDALGGARVRVFARQTLPEWHLVRRGITYVPSRHIGTTAWHLRQYGPFDLIINCAPSGKDGHLYALHRLFLHLRAGGAYVLDRAMVTEKEWKQLRKELGKIAPLADDGDPGTPEYEFSAAVRGVSIDRDAIAITKRNDHWVKLRNEEADRFLPTRDVPATSRLIESVPHGTFTSRAELDLHESTTEPQDFPETFSYPQLYLHEYTGDITVASHSLLFCENTVLPESFRYQQVPVLTNTKLIDPSPAWLQNERMPPKWLAPFARVPDHLHADRELEGEYFHLDCPFPGHFGHMMTEVVSRLWGWQQAKRDNPDLKAILRVYRSDRMPRLEQTLFTAYGIPADDIVWTGEPVRVRSIVGATPMWQNKPPHYVHPDILDTYRRLQDGLIIDGEPTAEKIFVSRKGSMRRGCRNGRDVEAYFAEEGFTIVYPETMDLAHQATMFAGARVIAGFGGSAMFNIMFARRMEKLIVLTHDSYTARNEYLYASVLGCETHYLWSDPDIWHPEGTWRNAAFQSSWEFDFPRNRPILDKIID